MIPLIALDIDGTLVGSKGFVEDCVWQAVEKAQTAGIKLAVCTGRPCMGVAKRIAERLSPNGLHIFQNGAHIAYASGEPYKVYALKDKATKELIKHARKHNLTLELYTPTNLYVERRTEIGDRHARMIGVTPLVRDLSDVRENEPVIRAQWVIPASQVPTVLELELEGVESGMATSPAQEETFFVSLTQVGVSKGEAVRVLADANAIALEHVMAVGDSQGDIPMLEVVGHPVVMNNAPFDLKDRFKVIAGDIEDCGVVAAFNSALESA